MTRRSDRPHGFLNDLVREMPAMNLGRSIVIGAILSLSPALASAATKFWKNSVTSGNWSEGNNWSNLSAAGADNGGAPGAGDTTNIAFTDGVARTVTLDTSTPSLGLLSIDLTGAGTAASTLSIPNNFNVTAAAIAVGGWNGAAFTNGRGAVSQSAGTATISPGVDLILAWGAGSTGNYTLSGGNLVANQTEWVGFNGTGTFNHNGGTNTILPSGFPALIIGNNAGSTGSYVITGGTLNAANNILVGNFGTGTLTISGTGSVSTNNLSINSASNVNLNGGTLRLNTVGGTGGVGRINFNSGTIQLAGNRTFDIFEPVINPLFPSPAGTIVIPAGKGLTVEGNSAIGGRQFLVNGGSFTTKGSLAFTSTAGFGDPLIDNGATVVVDGNTSMTDFVDLQISGPGTTWTNGGSVLVGTMGRGGLVVSNQAVMQINGNLTIGSSPDLHLTGGTLRLNTYSRTSGFLTFSFTSGTLELTGNRTIGSDLAIQDFFGVAPTVGSGKQLVVQGMASLTSSTPISLAGGTFAAGTFALQTGSRITTSQASQMTGPVIALPGSTIDATGGNLTLGDASKVNGFYGSGTISVGEHSLTIADANDAVLDSAALVMLGAAGTPGTLEVPNGLTLDFGANITGHGTVDTPNDPFRPLINNGHITGTSGTQLITLPGYIKGVGTLDNVAITGTFAPGFSPATVYAGNVQYAGTLQIELGGASPGSFDRLVHSGAVTLGGSLDVSLIGDFMPTVGQSFNILDWGSLTGTFNTVQLPTLTAGLAWDTSQLYTDGTLAVSSTTFPGDFNQDGAVNAADYIVWRKGVTVDPTQPNYNTWHTHFGEPAPGVGDANGAIPEPNSILLLAILLLPPRPRSRVSPRLG